MKLNSLLGIAVCMCALFFTSCKTMNLPYTSVKTEPYVRLKTGEKYVGKSIDRSSGFLVKDRITLDDTTFKTRDVDFFSTGSDVYANVGGREFALQVGAGKIGLFKYETLVTSYDRDSHSAKTHRRIIYYIQKQPDAPLMGLTYKNLKPLVMPNTPEYAMLAKFEKTRKIQRIIGYSSLGLLVGCIPVALSDGKKGSAAGKISSAMAITAVVGLPTCWMMKIFNYPKLLKTVIIADKIEKDKNAKHRRVE